MKIYKAVYKGPYKLDSNFFMVQKEGSETLNICPKLPGQELDLIPIDTPIYIKVAKKYDVIGIYMVLNGGKSEAA